MKYIKSLLFIICVVGVSTTYAQDILTKKETVKQALENNYGILLSKNQEKIANNNAHLYNSGFLPTVGTNAGFNYNLNNQKIKFQTGVETTTNGEDSKAFNAGVNVNYTIFNGFSRKYNFQALKETHQLSELQTKEVIENTFLNIFNLYYQVARLDENNENITKVLAISKQRLQRAEYRYEYGQVTKLEVLNASVDVNNDSIQLLNSAQQLANIKRELKLVIGNTEFNDFDVEKEVLFNELLQYNDILEKALKNNIVIKQNVKQTSIAQNNLKVNKAGKYPTLGVSSAYLWNKNFNQSTSFLAESMSYGLNAGVNLSYNIFDGGTTKTKIANAKIAIDNQELINNQSKDNLKVVVKNTWDDYQNKLFIYRTQKLNVQTAQNNFDRTNERYKLGQVTSIEFRQAQINLLQALTAVNNAKYDAIITELSLSQLSGDLLNLDF